MAVLPGKLLRCLGQLTTRLRRRLQLPSHTLQLLNLACSSWTFALASGETFREEAGSLAFYRMDPASGSLHFAGWLWVSGDAIELRAGGSYQVQVFTGAGAFFRQFQLVDAQGEANGARFLMDSEKEGLVVRIQAGASIWNTSQPPLRQITPGILAIASNGWQELSIPQGAC